MESCWVYHRAAYRCSHGHSSATTPEPGRPRNAYVREDHILPHLPALAMRITAAQDGEIPKPGTGTPPTESEAIERLRAEGITLTYDPKANTVTTDTEQRERILIA
ncbi:hypothetical protein ACO0M4_09760 [Streptomyces sp. RGM 3693]|uniref:hypothetical protein n=1 Tax=Streptomyces sp. RGM 3693 TaxID=3413284 RepID=UPI003D2A8286